MSEGTCNVEDCDKVAKNRGWCWGHYNRNRRYGSPTAPLRQGKNPPECTVEACDTKPVARGLCYRHWERWSKFGDPSLGQDRYRGDAIGYASAHRRVREVRGDVSAHACSCGAQAREWAYDHADPLERLGADRAGGTPRPYSLNADHYLPMCRSCHRKFDHPARRADYQRS